MYQIIKIIALGQDSDTTSCYHTLEHHGKGVWDAPGASCTAASKSAASAAIATIEDIYQVKLFDRVGRSVFLSDLGRRFLPEAQGAIASAKNATKNMIKSAASSASAKGGCASDGFENDVAYHAVWHHSWSSGSYLKWQVFLTISIPSVQEAICFLTLSNSVSPAVVVIQPVLAVTRHCCNHQPSGTL